MLKNCNYRFRTILVFIILIPAFMFLSSCYCNGASLKNANVNKTITNLKQSLKQLKVEKIEVIHLSSTYETRSSLNPGDVEKLYTAKYVVREVSAYKQFSKWLSALSGTTFLQPIPGYGEYRWACIFYDENDKRICTIYFDTTGKNAQINGVIVSVKGKLFTWINSSFGLIMD